MPKLDQLPAALAALQAEGLLRVPDDGSLRAALRERFGSSFIDASSNNYLGLAAAGDSWAPAHGAEVSPTSLPGGSSAQPHARDVSRETSEALPSLQAQALPTAGAEASRAPRPSAFPPAGLEVLPPREPPVPGSAPRSPGPSELTPTVQQSSAPSPASPESPGLSGQMESVLPSATSRLGLRHSTSEHAAGAPRGAAEAHDVSRETPLGAGASRLIHGTHPSHLAVERFAAGWLGQAESLLFASGYAANVGALGALLDRNDLVVSDALNHASLIDGIRLSRAEVVVTPHGDLTAVRAALGRPTAGARWVVVESYYSMDGTSPDLPALRALCDAAGAHLYVDEAHAVGVFGPEGSGLAAQQGVKADVTMAAFGKAVGSAGAVVASSAQVRTWLWNRARSFVFSTAPSPAQTESLLAQLERTRLADAARLRLLALSAQLRERLLGATIPLAPGSHGPILSVVVGSPEKALALGRHLAEAGVLVQAIRPPTVPPGQSRIRLTLTAELSDSAAARLAEALIVVWQKVTA